MPKIKLALNENHCAILTVMWADDFKKVTYTVATTHYIKYG